MPYLLFCQVASTEPYAHKVEVVFCTNFFGMNMVCDMLFPILKDGARFVLFTVIGVMIQLFKIAA